MIFQEFDNNRDFEEEFPPDDGDTWQAYFDISIKGKPKGRVTFDLWKDKSRNTCQNFLQLCANTEGLTYRNTKFFRVTAQDFVIGGDVTHNNGLGGQAAEGINGFFTAKGKFEAHDRPGIM